MLSKDLLLSVTRPARYIGGEINAVKKDLTKVDVTVCLCFPDTYDIGMSHLGLRILYDVINNRKEYAAERVFSPWVDMEEKMRHQGIPLWSLESQRPVKDFDILGFSLQVELSYTNVLNILSLAGIPLKASERDRRFPLVIAGGVCCLNPEPLAEFIDVFVIGEAEEVMLELLETYRRHEAGHRKNKDVFLKVVSGIEGVYVPSCYDPNQGKIKKRFVKNLDSVLDEQNWMVPYVDIVHDRLSLEIMRGCPHHCRFCQARSSFAPLRIASKEKILKNLRRLYRQTGYEEISLLSLSSSDHPDICGLVGGIMAEFKDKGVSVSLPSLRARHLVGELSQMLSMMRKTTLTFAPEAGSERLRGVIRKDVGMEELFSVAGQAYRAGYRFLKLYFMIGLPTETKEDLNAIEDVCRRLVFLKKEIDGHPARLNVSISNFVPKPHTPFQWQAMASVEEIYSRQGDLKSAFRNLRGRAQLKFHNVEMSFLEAVLSRGDRSLSSVILQAFHQGAKFDAWEHGFNFRIWQEAFQRSGIDPATYVQARLLSERLPWDFIDVGIPAEIFKAEARLAAGDPA